MTTRMLRMVPAMALVLGMFSLPAMASAATEAGVMKVEDDASVFSAAGISKARGEFEAVPFKAPTHLYVYTVNKIPSDKQKDFDAVKGNSTTRTKFFQDWAKELAKSKDRKGDVFVLLYMTEKAYLPVVIADEDADVRGHFNDAEDTAVAGMFNEAMKTVHDEKLSGAAAHEKMDAALVKGTERVISVLKDRPAPVTGGKHNVNAAHSNTEKGSGIMGYVCIGLCVLLGAWLVIGLIRAFTGGGGGGGMGGGGYGGGGGGGFMSSMLGGMFGAAAGMYLYDQFSGHNSHNNDYGNSGSGNDYNSGGDANTGDGNYDGGSAGAGDGGGDWGDSGGGDVGGGGDWGGGGDVGGGDFGGGDW
ncbi:hypothetical protein BH11PLA2_BH11PLA2_27370 [soil metagenome]